MVCVGVMPDVCVCVYSVTLTEKSDKFTACSEATKNVRKRDEELKQTTTKLRDALKKAADMQLERDQSAEELERVRDEARRYRDIAQDMSEVFLVCVCCACVFVVESRVVDTCLCVSRQMLFDVQ